MGLDATVMCNCIKEGLKIPEEFIDFFEMDEEGYPSLTIDYNGNEEIHHKFDDWVSNSCSHGDMDFVVERISNWYGVRVFQNVLSRNNSTGKFDTLLCEIPNANGGITLPERSGKMLDELKEFQSIDNYGKKHVLVNEQSGDEVWEYIPQYEGKMILSGTEKIDLGLDEAGFFAQSTLGEELFRSTRFKQVLKNIEITEQHGSAEVEYIDLTTDRCFTCHSAISGRQIQWPDGNWENAKGQVRFDYPEYFFTDIRDREVDEFQYIIEPLRIICAASLETGNPVRWC